jgi:hypothetical protein
MMSAKLKNFNNFVERHLMNKNAAPVIVNVPKVNFNQDEIALLNNLIDQGFVNSDYYRKKYQTDMSDEEVYYDFIKNSSFNARSYSDKLDTIGYLLSYPDIAMSGVSPVVHYAVHGCNEFRPVIRFPHRGFVLIDSLKSG